MRDAGHRTPDAGHRTSDGEKSKNNISTPQGGGHNKISVSWLCLLKTTLKSLIHFFQKHHTIHCISYFPKDVRKSKINRLGKVYSDEYLTCNDMHKLNFDDMKIRCYFEIESHNFTFL